MSILSQGTQIFFVDTTGTSPAIVRVERTTTFNPGGAPADQIEDTALEDFERSYKSGLRTPGSASLGINADPKITSHIKLHELSEANPSPAVKWVVGWSDGTEPPTLDVDNSLVLPDTRTWFTFSGYVSDFPFDFSQNTVVTTELSIQRSGGSAWTPKVVTP